jgi:outer membrane protein TolC
MLGFFLTLAVILGGQDAPTMTLDEALAIAEAQAFELRVAESNIAEARSNRRVAEAALGPGATLSGTTQWSNTVTPGQFGQNGSQTTNTINLGVSQIIDISRVVTLRLDAATLNVKVNEFAKETVRNDLRSQVRTKYLAVLQAKEFFDIQNAAVVSAEKRLADAQIRFNAEAIPKFDVLRLESDLKRLQQARIQAEGNLRIAKQDLNNLLARPIETEFTPVPVENDPQMLRETVIYVRGSLFNRPELKRAEAGIEALAKSREAEQRAALPTLTLSAGHTEIIDPGFGQPERQTSASATVSVPIVTSGAIKANTQRVREQEERAKILLQQVQLAVAFEVRVAVTQYETAFASYESAKSNRILAEEALRLAQLRYDEEVGILLDVIVGQQDLVSAQSAEVAALYQLRAAYVALQKAVGVDDLTNLPEATPAPAEGGSKEEGQ